MQNLRIKLEKHLNRRNKNDNSKNKESSFWMHGGSGICIGNNRGCKRTPENVETEQIEGETTQEVQPTELDLGDYQAEMTVGENQLLTITILPA